MQNTERRINMHNITLRTGEVVEATLIRVYGAFEGGMRYIFKTAKGEVRCIKDANENYVEYVA
jgi:hypothetical protein